MAKRKRPDSQRSAAPEPSKPGSRIAELHPRRFFLQTWAWMDDEAARDREARRAEGRGYDWRPALVLAVGAALLAFKEYYGGGDVFVGIIDALGEDRDGFYWRNLRTSTYFELYTWCWWSGWRVLTYFAIPALMVRLVLKERVADHGLSTRGVKDDLWIYGLAYAVVLVCVIGVSYTEAFSTKYPFYDQAGRSWFDFLAWELIYLAQFFSLEFFFRGHWLAVLRPAMGSYAIFAMVVPYCMVHFGKPLAETLAAIVAGIVLGTLAMKTRSIWNGFLIHSSVAVSMDVAALLQGPGLPDRFWP